MSPSSSGKLVKLRYGVRLFAQITKPMSDRDEVQGQADSLLHLSPCTSLDGFSSHRKGAPKSNICFKGLFLFYLSECFACMSCLSSMCMPGSHKNQKRASESLELKLPVVPTTGGMLGTESVLCGGASSWGISGANPFLQSKPCHLCNRGSPGWNGSVGHSGLPAMVV